MFQKFVKRLWFAHLDFAETYKLPSLGRTFFWLVVVWIIGTNLVYFTETSLISPEELSQSPFRRGYLHAYWMIITVITSAGIEEGYSPVSWVARIEVVALAFVGICLVTVLTANVVAAVVQRVRRRDLMRLKPQIKYVGHFTNHIIICNASTKFEPVLRQIVDKVDRDTKMVLVDEKASSYPTERRVLFRNTYAVNGKPDNLRVLKQADIATARAIIILTPELAGMPAVDRDYIALVTAVVIQPLARSLGIKPRIILEVNDKQTLQFVDIFNELANYPLYIEPVCAASYQERLLSQASMTMGLSHLIDHLLTVPYRVIRQPFVLRFLNSLFLGAGEKEEELPDMPDCDVEIRSIPVGLRFEGHSYQDLVTEIEEHNDVTILGYLRWPPPQKFGTTRPEIKINPQRKPTAEEPIAPSQQKLTARDEIFVLASAAAFDEIEDFLQAGLLQRLGNALRGDT